MIRQLHEQDRKDVMKFLQQEPAYNIFIIGDIEHFGFDADFQQVYAEYDTNNIIQSVFLRYRENGVYYAPQPRFNQEYIPIIEQYNIRIINGKADIIDALYPFFPQFNRKNQYFCATDKNALIIEQPDDPRIQKLETIHDMERLYDLLASISEFSIHKIPKEQYVSNKQMSLQMGETYFIEADNRIVATVAVTAENTVNGMAVAVATHPNYRKRGYATLLMQQLLYRYIVEKEKDLCLFYDNPEAGAIYLRLGFVPIGKWSMCERRD